MTEGEGESSPLTEESRPTASPLLGDEREVTALLSELGLSHESHSKKYFSFSDLRRGAYSPSMTRWFPRAYLPALQAQLGDKVEQHPTSTGLMIPARGYVELTCSRFILTAATRLFQLQSPAVNCVHRGQARALPSLPYHWPGDETESVKRVHLSGVDSTEPCIEISNASPLAMLLYGAVLETGRMRLASRRIPFLATLKIVYDDDWDRERIGQSSEATARSLLYELDYRNGVVIELDAPSAGLDISLSRRLAEPSRSISYPDTTIDYEVSVLFGFASQITDDPPHAFLSYYKALEYFIPKAVNQRAIKSIRRELGDPVFDKTDYASMLRIVEAAKGPKNTSEQGQLRVVINEFVRPSCLEDFFDRDWGDYFTPSGPIKGVQAIQLKNSNMSLPNQVADRISQIRNRLVHAKDEPKLRDARVLLPRSTAANALTPDVMLVRLLATEAISGGLST